jgi:hypothetical protein
VFIAISVYYTSEVVIIHASATDRKKIMMVDRRAAENAEAFSVNCKSDFGRE